MDKLQFYYRNRVLWLGNSFPFWKSNKFAMHRLKYHYCATSYLMSQPKVGRRAPNKTILLHSLSSPYTWLTPYKNHGKEK